MKEEDVKRILEVYKKPFEYRNTMIIDANRNHVLDIRGWGRLQHLNDGGDIQDNLGELITEFLNKQLLSTSKPEEK